MIIKLTELVGNHSHSKLLLNLFKSHLSSVLLYRPLLGVDFLSIPPDVAATDEDNEGGEEEVEIAHAVLENDEGQYCFGKW